MADLTIRKKWFYYVFLCLILVAGLFVLVRLSPVLVSPGNLASDDFVQFWVWGKINLKGLNPFDSQAIQQLRNAVGSDNNHEIISTTLYPPWVIPFLMMTGAFSYPVSRILWLLVAIMIILFSSRLLWSVYKGKRKLQWLNILAVLLFAPTISMLEKGQITCIVLLGLAGFLYSVSIEEKDWLAGVCLALVAFKPQMLLLFWLMVFTWSILQKRWKILAGAAATILGLTLIALLFNPRILQQYWNTLQSYRLSEWATPTIGAYLRYFWFGTDKFWIQFLPTILGVIWLAYFIRKVKMTWDWTKILPIVLFASMISSPYAWTYDQVILIPAVIQATIWIAEFKKVWVVIIGTITYITLNLLNLGLHMKVDDFWFIWFAPILLIWYLTIKRQSWYVQKQPKLSGQIVG